MFTDLVQSQVSRHIATTGHDDVAAYLTELLLEFVRTDSIFSIKDKTGKPLRSVFEMMAEGDIRLNAESFERERQVHKHIGDFILFWSGVYPDHLSKIKVHTMLDLVCDYSRQARESYHLVSTFDHEPYDDQAPTFRKLSEGFDDYRFILARVAQQANLHVA